MTTMSAVTLLAVGMLAAGQVQAQAAPQGRWTGAILVLGSELGMTVTFTAADSGLSATMDIPQQSAKGLRLQKVSYEAPAVHFELMGGPGLAVFDGTLEGDSITGSFVQSGVQGTFWLRPDTGKASAAPAAAEPAPEPVPYAEEEVTFSHDDVTLAGTLTIPEGSGPFPAVVLITGSGAQNRDEELLGLRPFRWLADHLTRHGIAVLRYDDRGVGGSSGSVQSATSEDFASDALAGVHLLEGRSEIAPQAIGLIGHSEGGIVAPMAAVRSPSVAFIVLMAGTSVTGEDILYAQAEAILRANGASEEQIRIERQVQEALFHAVHTDEGWEEARQMVEDQARAAIENLPDSERAAITDIDSFVKTRAQQQILVVRLPWFRFFLDFDPATVLEQVGVPVLALFGEKDLQVPPEVNIAPMRAALERAPTTDYTIEVIPGANHLFQEAVTGSPNEYATLKKEFAPGFLELMTDWILKRAGTTGG
jgi:pimeloyl-ACP methyl ester carboxylesterase